MELNRRALIGGGTSLLAAGAMLQSTGAKASTSRQAISPHNYDHDIIVMGAGFSGITAARDLAENGFDVSVLEAGGRIGGRTYTWHLGDHKVELGGTWIHWFQPHVWAEINRYGLKITEMPRDTAPQANVLVGGRSVTLTAQEMGMKSWGAFEKVFGKTRPLWERPYDASFTWDKITATEPATVRERMVAVELDEVEQILMEAVINAMAHTTTDKASFVEMSRWYAAAGWSFSGVGDTTARYMFEDGTISLVEAMVSDADIKIELGAVVTAVEQKEDHVVVTTDDGQTVTALAAVNTIPMNALGDVSFGPALSGLKNEASKEGHGAEGIKLYAEFENSGAWSSCFAPETEGITWWTPYKRTDRGGIWIGFGPHRDLLDGNDRTAVEAEFQKFFPEARILDLISHGWNDDPFARGTYCSYRPGQLAKLGDEMYRHEGRIFMASGDHGPGGWRGFIDGAIAAGTRAASDASHFLQGEGE